MSMAEPLPRGFYDRDPVEVARALLGKKLVREYQGNLLSGMITETEAYLGEKDSASHAYRGMTKRNAVLFGEAGHAYVYFIYGMHHMLNVSAGGPGTPGAVLVRAIEPRKGMEVMQRLRKGTVHLADGPGKLCRALAIGLDLNGWDLTRGRQLWIEDYLGPDPDLVVTGPRIGIAYAEPEHQAAPWRFFIKNQEKEPL
jgi:DNA-3-methyladenine glycosylase